MGSGETVYICVDTKRVANTESECLEAIIWAERRAREIGSWLKQHKEVKVYIKKFERCLFEAWVAIDDIDFSWADSVKVVGTPLMKLPAQRPSHHGTT